MWRKKGVSEEKHLLPIDLYKTIVEVCVESYHQVHFPLYDIRTHLHSSFHALNHFKYGAKISIPFFLYLSINENINDYREKYTGYHVFTRGFCY